MLKNLQVKNYNYSAFIRTTIKSLVVIGMDFYQTGYYLGYKNLNNEEQIEKIRKINQSGKFHDMVSQIKYLAKIWKEDDRLKVDDVLEKILTQ